MNTTSYVFDEWNQLIETVYDEGEETEFSVSTTYDLLGRVIEETYDEQTTTYTYDNEGNIIKVATPEVVKDYTYTNGLLTKRQDTYKYIVTDEQDEFIALYEYDGFGNLKSHTYRDYTFTYNTFGNILTANVGIQQIVEYEYTEDTKQEVVSAEYANEQVLTYLYTDDDWEIICLNDYVMYESCNVHNEDGSITTTTKDLINNINKITEENGFTVSDSENQTLYSVQKYEKDETDENSFDGERVNVGINEYKFVSNNNEDTFSKNDTLLFSKTSEEDLSGKLAKETVNSNISTEYGYGANSMVTVLKNTVDDMIFSYNYSYDSEGNVLAETLTRKSVGNQGETIDDSETTIYTYYDNQQLFSAENDTTRWEYTYDERGNILTRQEYNVSINNNGEKVYSFRDYDSWTLDSNWKDKLAKFNGQTITYDAIGNPISYKGNTLTWTMGRQLASYGSNSYKYNEYGVRTSKTVNGVTTKYYLNGTDIIEQTDGTNTLHFYYDSTGEIIGFTYNDSQYFYIKNVQDDIIAIADSSGNIVSEYAYDPWGAVISVTGSNTEIGNLNPFRYRSYYYDSEIGMYYLQSRYYDPEICRFINCDDVNYIGVTQSEISYNPFAYCENDPVNRVDALGRFPTVIRTIFSAIKVAKSIYDNFLCVRLYCWGFTHRKSNQTYNFSNKWNKLLTKRISGSKAIIEFAKKQITFMIRRGSNNKKIETKISFYDYIKSSVSDLDLTLAIGGGGTFLFSITKVKKNKNGIINYKINVELKNEIFNFEYWKINIGKKQFGIVDPHSTSKLVTIINNIGYFTQECGAFVPYTWNFSVSFKMKVKVV